MHQLNLRHLPETGLASIALQKRPKLNLLGAVPSSYLKSFTMAATNHRRLLAH
jgi:hypothetical protein